MALESQPADAVELMDRAALRSVEHQDGMPCAVCPTTPRRC